MSIFVTWWIVAFLHSVVIWDADDVCVFRFLFIVPLHTCMHTDLLQLVASVLYALSCIMMGIKLCMHCWDQMSVKNVKLIYKRVGFMIWITVLHEACEPRNNSRSFTWQTKMRSTLGATKTHYMQSTHKPARFPAV